METNTIELKQFKVLEDILNSIDHLDKDILKETLAYLLKTYIIDREVEYEGKIYDNIDNNQHNNELPISINYKSPTFADLIYEFKNKYAIPEIDLFSIENGKVFIQLDDKKHLISKDSANTSSVSEKKIKTENASSSNISKTSPERFKNLEMDG